MKRWLLIVGGWSVMVAIIETSIYGAPGNGTIGAIGGSAFGRWLKARQKGSNPRE